MSEPMLRLHVVPAHGEPFDKVYEGPTLVIGRSSDSGVVVADRFLSRHHAQLTSSGSDVSTPARRLART